MAFSKNSNSAETGRQYQSFDNALTHAKESQGKLFALYLFCNSSIIRIL
jgi:hypothetical protein